MVGGGRGAAAPAPPSTAPGRGKPASPETDTMPQGQQKCLSQRGPQGSPGGLSMATVCGASGGERAGGAGAKRWREQDIRLV